MVFEFKGKGLKTEQGARARLDKFAEVLRDAKTVVCVQDGEFYPVVIYADHLRLPLGHLASNGICILGG